MSITCAPDHLLAHPPSHRPSGDVRVPAWLGRVAVLLAVLFAAGGVVHAFETRSAGRLDAVMTSAAQALLPGGRVGAVDVVDGPALLADRRARVGQTTATGRTRDGLPVRLDIRDYDRATGVAQSVSWQVTGLPVPAGWRAVDGAGAYLNQIEQEIDGHRVRLTATAAVQGDHVLVVPGQLSVDDAPAALADAPPAVRAAVGPMLTPWHVGLPVPGVPVSVRYVWFAGDGIGVDLRAGGVPAATGGR